MRIISEIHIEVTNGLLALCDGLMASQFATEETRRVRLPAGQYEVFVGQGYLIVNTAPEDYDGSDWKDVASVGRVDLPSGVLSLLDGALMSSDFHEAPTVFLHRFAFNHLTSWLESPDYDHDPGWNPFATVLGVGGEVRPVLAGPNATLIHRMEKRLAEAMRSKGQKKQRLLAELRAEANEMISDGVTDYRLRQIASVLKISIPTPGVPSIFDF